MIELREATVGQEIPLGYFLDPTTGDDEETGLTIANTDIKLWKNGATVLVNKNSGGATHISNGIYYTVLDDIDSDTPGPLVVFIHVAGALAIRVVCAVLKANVWDSKYSTDKLEVDAEAIADVVWDELLTGATHNIPTSAGRKLREASDAAVIRSEEIAQGGSLTTITLNNNASAIDDFYKASKVIITDGTGVGQVRAILSYVGSTRVASMGDPWKVAPDGTSKYIIRGHAGLHIQDLSATALAEVKAEVVKALNVDTYLEPGQENPSATASIVTKIGHLFKAYRNKKDNDGATRKIYNDAGTVVDQKSSLNESSGVVTVGKVESGP